MQVRSLGQEDPLEEGMATHSRKKNKEVLSACVSVSICVPLCVSQNVCLSVCLCVSLSVCVLFSVSVSGS